MFFFSSRRRHTRFDCDWSSDVCSSDLCVCIHVRLLHHILGFCVVSQNGTGSTVKSFIVPAHQDFEQADMTVENSRSEERRVGKSVELSGRRISKTKRK